MYAISRRWASSCKTLASLTTSALTNFIPPVTLTRYFQLYLTKVNEVRQFVHIVSVIYISFYSLTSRTRIDTVELIVRKYLLLWSVADLENFGGGMIKFMSTNCV